MKKKAIEKIPYLTLPKVSRKKDVKYIGRTAIKMVENEMHFFLEVYKNEKMTKVVPVVRIVMNKKDFGTYRPEDGSWTRAKLTLNGYCDALIWETENSRGYTYDRRRKQNILYAPEDLERVKKYFKDINVWNDGEWWKYISEKQDRICYEERNARRRRAYDRRKAALEDRAKHTPLLDEKKLLEYADRVVFIKKHYLYYKKKGRRAEVCCSKCGGVTTGAFKPGISYESNFESFIEEPRESKRGTCPMCHEPGIYKCQGKANRKYRESRHIFLMDRYKETGVVIRYVELGKEWQLEEICGEKGPKMHGAYEKLDGVEIARTYIHPKEKIQTDFHKYSYHLGEDFWDDCNLYGNNNIQIKPAEVHPEAWKALEGTCLQYSQAREFMEEVGSEEVALNQYMERYMATPQIEMLVKMKLYGVAGELAKYRYGIVEDQNAKSLDAFLGIKKDKVKFLIDRKGDVDILEILKMEKRMAVNWTEEQVEKLAEIGAEQRNLELALQFMTLQKILNTIGKYAGCEYGTECGHAMGKLRHTATTYFDYLSMRVQRGYDLTNTVYQRPRNLEAEHNKMVAEIDKEKQDNRNKEVAERFPLIRKNYRKLRKRYLYADENFIIRPARSAEEIVQEGRILHHCVGGDNYLEKHNEGKSIILMLRFKDQQETPYITVEIVGERIIQWYGAHDKKPDQKNMDRWLDNYITRLKCLRDGTLQEAAVDGAGGTAMPLLAYA